ncbi:MAG: hypothetical protein ABSG36_11405 [Acidimicrobiales bacterium]|jgi:ABC-type transport system involved in multi-copper enzyme maturation permease subunit
MTWVTWRQYRYPGVLAAALLGSLAVLLLITGLHAASVWHSVLARCLKDGSCANLGGSSLSLATPTVAALVVATSVVPLLPGLFLGTPMVAHELETGTNQFAWTQSITRRHWLAVRTGWLLLAAAGLAGAVSAVVTWWSGPSNALNADAFMVNRFDITDIVLVAYAIFAMALGICAGTLLRRTLPALAVTVAGFVGLRALVALWLRLHYMTPVTAIYKLTTQFTPTGSYLSIGQGMVGPGGKAFVPSGLYGIVSDGLPVPPACQNVTGGPGSVMSCMASHGYKGYVTYQPASRFWAFQGIETAIFVVLAAVMLGITFWVLERRDA